MTKTKLPLFLQFPTTWNTLMLLAIHWCPRSPDSQLGVCVQSVAEERSRAESERMEFAVSSPSTSRRSYCNSDTRAQVMGYPSGHH